MATPFAINTGSTISGTTQIGDIAVGNTVQDYSSDPGGVQWYMGPEDSTGYVVARPDPSIGHTTPAGGNVGLSFRRSSDFTESSYINLANSVSLEAGGTGITSSSEATIWFGEQGVYSSFNDLRLYLDVVNTNSYPGTGVTWNDLSGYGNIGTLNGPPTFSNDSMVFGGTDYVNIGKNSSLLIGNDVTISSWVKISATGSYYGIYGGSNQNGSPRRLEGGVMNLFVNGILQDETITEVVLYPTAEDTVIGRWYGNYNGFYFQGSIDVVRMYNVALSNTEILQNFNALRARFGS